MEPWWLLVLVQWVSAATFRAKVSTESHVSTVQDSFVSFTIDPKYLFSSTEKYNSNECLCMATSLTPAYLRIAGPSTSNLIFYNNSISIVHDHENRERKEKSSRKRHAVEKLSVSHNQWKKFAKWANKTGFDLVFAFNNQERTRSGMWDPNAALHVLTLAEKVDIGRMFWQLGYECTNQSIEEYLNDLQTLRVIVETFGPGQTLDWKVVGGDVTNCLQADSKSDFKDYVTLSLEMMDAVMFNGNSSSRQLERMTEYDRLKLLKLLSSSSTPLWITESTNSEYNELERAADWMASLGYSAKNGFAVHFREMREEELFKPTLSFYMAVLFKNLVGERVLNVDMDAEQAALFAHCTSLRHKPVPGAVTLYGVNMDDEPARFSVKLSKREEGGDIMQFILGYDGNGDITVNGHVMSPEGDVKPTIKRVSPYKTLLINLPPKSFGFWVLANTKVDACYDIKETSEEENLAEAEDVTEHEKKKHKRSVIEDFDDVDIPDTSEDFSELDVHENCNEIENPALKKTIDNLNKNLKKVYDLFGNKGKVLEDVQQLPAHPRNLRKKRYIDDSDDTTLGRIKKHLIKPLHERKKILNLDLKKNGLLSNLLQIKDKRNSKRNVKNEKLKFKTSKNKMNINTLKHSTEKRANSLEDIKVNKEKVSRKRRSVVFTEKQNFSKKSVKDSENEIEEEMVDSPKIWKMLNKIQKQLDKMQSEEKQDVEFLDDKSKDGQIFVKTKLLDDGAMINLSEHPDHGLIKSTFQNVFSVLGELNTNLNRVWNALTLLE